MSFIYWYNSQPIKIFIELVILLASLLKKNIYIYIYILSTCFFLCRNYLEYIYFNIYIIYI